jgi:hypothetical protein
VPGAKVRVLEIGAELARVATTSAEGYHVISALKPTNYSLTVEAPGFRTLSETGITLLANESVTMNLRVEVRRSLADAL